MNKKNIQNIYINGKKTLMRVDFNVPLDQLGKITDDTRIKAALPTIEYAIQQGAKIILMSHLGRPKGEIKKGMHLIPVAMRLGELLKQPIKMLHDCIGPEVLEAVNTMNNRDIVLLENLRFHKEETQNDPEFAKQLAQLGDVFVNDAFGTCHRAHASTEGVTHYLEAVAGFLVEKEIKYFEKLNASPEHPFILVLGGAKVSDKIPVIKNMLFKVDTIIIGGAMAYTFLKQAGVRIGSSRFEKDMIDTVSAILGKAKAKNVDILLPIDHIICDNVEDPQKIKTTDAQDIDDEYFGVDIGPKTIKLFKSILSNARTIVWNGPMGIFEKDAFASGTRQVAESIADSSATSVVGGGDSAAAAKKFGVENRVSHISTGGGASLEYLEGKILPGISALADKDT